MLKVWRLGKAWYEIWEDRTVTSESTGHLKCFRCNSKAESIATVWREVLSSILVLIGEERYNVRFVGATSNRVEVGLWTRWRCSDKSSNCRCIELQTTQSYHNRRRHSIPHHHNLPYLHLQCIPHDHEEVLRLRHSTNLGRTSLHYHCYRAPLKHLLIDTGFWK